MPSNILIILHLDTDLEKMSLSAMIQLLWTIKCQPHFTLQALTSLQMFSEVVISMIKQRMLLSKKQSNLLQA